MNRFLLSFATLAGLPPAATAQFAPDEAGQLLAQWRQRRDAVPAVRYTLRHQPGTWPPIPAHHTGTASILFDFGNRRVRIDQSDTLHLSNSRHPRSLWRRSFRFDGDDMTSYSKADYDAAAAPAEVKPDSVHRGPWGSFDTWPGELTPLLWAHGILWTEPNETGSRSPFEWEAKPGRFTVAGREVMDGRTCILFRDTAAPADRVETIGIDSDRDGAVVFRRRVGPDKHSTEVRLTYSQGPHGWLPSGWTLNRLRPGLPPVVDRRVTVESVDFAAIPAEEFRYDPKPGTMLVTLDGKSVIREDGTPEAAPQAQNYADLSFGQKVAASIVRQKWMFGGGLVTLVSLVAVLAWLRRKRAGQPGAE